MSLKEALTNSLLMFVAATCVVLIVKAISPAPGMASSSSADGTAAAPGGGDAPTLAMRDGVKAYYLHGNIRCPTCRTIESTAQEAVETGFADQLQSGRLQWQVINYETSGNEHYATDFEVVAPSVVLVKYADGQQTAWKSLPEVWELVGDKPAFIRFMQDSLREFIGASPSNSAGVSNVLRSPSESESWPVPIPE